jgi:uncharacterized protein YndB with AHSA1/START domain
VDEITVTTTIARPRNEVFDYLADIANHAEFSDHWMVDWHLTREDTFGEGAGARFRIKAPLNRFSWADTVLADLQPPYRIVQRGRGGKYNRIRMLGVWTLQPAAGDATRVEFSYETEPALPSDRFMEAVFGRWRTKRQLTRSLRRLRSILEENRGRGRRASIGGRDLDFQPS